MSEAKCCEQGTQFLQCHTTSRGVQIWLLRFDEEGTEIRFCPYCGHNLSKPVAAGRPAEATQ